MVDGRLLDFGAGDEGYGEPYSELRLRTPSSHSSLGDVTAGSLTKGLEIRLKAGVAAEDMAAGRYVTIEGAHSRFFGMITDVELRSAISQVLASPPEDEFTRQVLDGTAVYAVLRVSLMLRVDSAPNAEAEPVRTVPAHFAAARDTSQAEIEQIFGREDSDHF